VPCAPPMSTPGAAARAFPSSRLSPNWASPWNRFAEAAESSAECEEDPLRAGGSGPIRAVPQRITMTILQTIHRYADTGTGRVKPLAGELEGFLRLSVGNHRVFFKETDEAVSIYSVADRPRGISLNRRRSEEGIRPLRR
jgi:hypothetical protein